MRNGFFHRKIVTPLLDLLRQGVTPEKLALCVALGVTLGVTPVIGSTTILCAAAAAVLRLNLPAIQLVNYFVYPLQLILLVPFIRIGERIFAAPAVQISVAEILDLFQHGAWLALAKLWTAALHGLVAWMLIGTLALPVMYLVLLPVMRQLAKSVKRVAA